MDEEFLINEIAAGIDVPTSYYGSPGFYTKSLRRPMSLFFSPQPLCVLIVM